MDWFARRLLDWFGRHGRTDLPWQQDIDAYRVWVSEIMLQQTQVTTAIPYYRRFIGRFPDLAALAAAELDEVLHHWSGLGYYARGRNLHKAARQVMAEQGGCLPADVEALARLPGIGRSTAGAIAAIAYGIRAPILDGNVKRVLARFHAVAGYPGDVRTGRVLWQLADQHTPQQRIGAYTQAIMDLGATVCTRARARCQACPVSERCAARLQHAVDSFPHRRPRADKPARATRLFLVVDASGRCLLQQRPPTGLWGGLWSPPERPPDTTASAICGEFGIDPGAIADQRSGKAFRHTFTHFHLDIEPVYLTLAGAATGAADRPDLCWYHPTAAGRPSLGLSAPAAKLLASLSEAAQLLKEKP